MPAPGGAKKARMRLMAALKHVLLRPGLGRAQLGVPCMETFGEVNQALGAPPESYDRV